MGAEGTTEVEDQAGKFVLIFNDEINAMKKYQFYDDIL